MTLLRDLLKLLLTTSLAEYLETCVWLKLVCGEILVQVLFRLTQVVWPVDA